MNHEEQVNVCGYVGFMVTQKLPVTGFLSPETFKCLQEHVNSVKNKLDKLGFKCPDPIKNATSFGEIVKQFQVTLPQNTRK
jgi:hypothetical protein